MKEHKGSIQCKYHITAFIPNSFVKNTDNFLKLIFGKVFFLSV